MTHGTGITGDTNQNTKRRGFPISTASKQRVPEVPVDSESAPWVRRTLLRSLFSSHKKREACSMRWASLGTLLSEVKQTLRIKDEDSSAWKIQGVIKRVHRTEVTRVGRKGRWGSKGFDLQSERMKAPRGAVVTVSLQEHA